MTPPQVSFVDMFKWPQKPQLSEAFESIRSLDRIIEEDRLRFQFQTTTEIKRIKDKVHWQLRL